MALKPCRECKKKVSTEATACPNCGAPHPTTKATKITEPVFTYKFGDVTVENKETNIIRVNQMETFARCNKSFCTKKYQVIKISKSELGKELCKGCGNLLSKVSEEQAKQYFENKNIDFSKVKTDRFENLGKMTKKFKDKAIMENAGKAVGSLMKSKKTKKKLSDMSKEELINEVTETKFHSLSNKQLIGGCIGIVGYIIVKEIGGWGWHYGDIVGLFLLAFLPGALFIGGMLEDW